MDEKLRKELKQNLKKSITKYISKFKYKSNQPLDLLIPTERKIRSVVGGLETSMGTTVWEPIAKTLAKKNGFEIIDDKILQPYPFPAELALELSVLVTLRESRTTWVSTQTCIERLRKICKNLDRTKLQYIAPSAGTGVDIRIKKNGLEYAFDTKTVQPNMGGIKSFNKELLEWYAYILCKDPNINISCKIAYPYNPYSDNFWTHVPHNRGILETNIDAVVENDFWDFLSGRKGTYQEIVAILVELNDEGFGRKLSRLIKKIHRLAQTE
ncbi:MAG: TdeIII family type II restriction endonuclease [bacterium]|nr:TdeIII family type II restriction endonuclease [bacterium]